TNANQVLAGATIILVILAWFALKDTEETLELSQRAWVGPTDAKLMAAPEIGKDTTIVVTVHNTGHSPPIDDFATDAKPFVVTAQEIDDGSLDKLGVWSQALMVHYFLRHGGMHFGPSSSWQRHDDRGNPSSDTANAGAKQLVSVRPQECQLGTAVPAVVIFERDLLSMRWIVALMVLANLTAHGAYAQNVNSSWVLGGGSITEPTTGSVTGFSATSGDPLYQ